MKTVQPVADQRGASDFRNGTRYDENPYNANTHILKHCAWNKSYVKAEREYRDKMQARVCG